MPSFFNTNVENILRNDLEMAYEDMAYGGNLAVLIGLFEKKAADGDAVKVPLKRNLGAGQSGTANTAYTNATLAGRDAFVVTPFKCYGMSVIPLDQAAWTKGDNSVVDLLMDESKSAMDSAKLQLDQALGSDGYGTLGTISSNTNPSGNLFVLTLTLYSDVNHFSVGQVLVSKATPATGSLDSGTAVVTAVNASVKKITVDGGGTWTPTNGHVLGLQGTMIASTAISTWPGIPAWIPPSASRPLSTADSFFSVNRSVDERRLAGSYLDGTKMSILEGINRLAYMIADVPNAKPDLIVASFQTIGAIQAALQTQGRYNQDKIKGAGIDVYYEAVTVAGPKGKMAIVGSSNWPGNLVAVLDSSTWVVAAPGNRPFVPATSTGNPIVEIPGQDQCVAQYRSQACVYCTAPGWNGMLTINPVTPNS